MEKQTLVLAAIAQIGNAVQKIARKGEIDEQELELFVSSIINLSPENYLSVYGDDLNNLKPGLLILTKHLGDESHHKDPELTRYIVSLMALERRLNKKPKSLQELSSRIDNLARQLDHFDKTSDNIIASVASIYSDVISPLGNRIQVAGEPEYLKQNNNQNKIRALLLAGIRAVVLWRQVGGKRRNVLWHRRKIVREAQQLLNGC